MPFWGRERCGAVGGAVLARPRVSRNRTAPRRTRPKIQAAKAARKENQMFRMSKKFRMATRGAVCVMLALMLVFTSNATVLAGHFQNPAPAGGLDDPDWQGRAASLESE